MAFPEPQPGLVISYAYLWHHEHHAGHKEGIKDRPCVIVVVKRPTDGKHLVRVVALTHRPPDDPSTAFKLPRTVKRHLGVDSERSWVILDEVNDFVWPGFDLRPIPRNPGAVAYGLLPPRLFDQLIVKIGVVWQGKQGKAIRRDRA